MNQKELCYLSAGQLARMIQTKEVSPVEVMEAHLSRIEALEPRLNSFITFLPDQARKEARRAEQEILAGRWRGPLHGIPLGLKDLYYVKGLPNTGGTKLFENFIPDVDSTVAGKLREAGAILIGKLNMHPLPMAPQEKTLNTVLCTTRGIPNSSREVRAGVPAQPQPLASAF